MVFGMVTTPPTAADLDTFFSGELAGLLANQFLAIGTGGGGLLGTALSFTAIVIGYTQDDGTQVIEFFADPTQSGNYDPDGEQLQGIMDAYGAVIFREYSWSYTVPVETDAPGMAADDTEQARINDPSNWASTAP
jgi:hypothetical protein